MQTGDVKESLSATKVRVDEDTKMILELLTSCAAVALCLDVDKDSGAESKGAVPSLLEGCHQITNDKLNGCIRDPDLRIGLDTVRLRLATIWPDNAYKLRASHIRASGNYGQPSNELSPLCKEIKSRLI